MYLHLGQDTIVNERDIVGVFDLDNSTVSRHTRDFLSKAQKEGREYKIKNFREKAPFSERLKEKLSQTRRYLRQYGLLYTMRKVYQAVAWRVFRR